MISVISSSGISSKTATSVHTGQNVSVDDYFTKRFAALNADINQKVETLNRQITEYQSMIENLKKKVAFANRYGSDRHLIYKDAIVYQDVFESLEEGLISKIGNPTGWDETTHAVNPWNRRRILKIGNGEQSDGNGISTIIPEGYDVLWLRVLNDRWTVFRAKFLDGDREDIGKFACGYRQLNEYSPDGTAPDSFHRLHMWCQIPTARSGRIGIFSEKNSDTWISGLGFSKNLWNHARNSGVAYHWAINGGTPTAWHTEGWNSDVLAGFNAAQTYEIRVPVVFSGRDKLLYVVEHNNNWLGTMHTNLTVNGVQVERFRTTYDNPFATHYNSKLYDRYIAARIPADLIKKEDKFVTVKIQMTLSDHHIHFREVGTHDFNN